MKHPVSQDSRQRVIELRRNHSYAEVAKKTGLPVGTVKTICTRSGAFRDNPAHRALFALPAIQASEQTALAMPQLPAQNAVTEQGYLRHRVLLLRNPTAFVEAYLSMNDDSRAGKKLFYKTSEIVALIGDTRSRVRLYENLTGNDAASGRSGDYRPSGTVILLDSVD
jgi:hypothetical protein